jgi:hypothetical protein
MESDAVGALSRFERRESLAGSESTDVTARIVICEAFVEGRFVAPRQFARTVHDLLCEPKHEEKTHPSSWRLWEPPPRNAIAQRIIIEF